MLMAKLLDGHLHPCFPSPQLAVWKALCSLHQSSWGFPSCSLKAEHLKLLGFLLHKIPISPVLCEHLCGFMGVCFILWILIQYHFIFKSFLFWTMGDLGIVQCIHSTILISVHVTYVCVYVCV